jgi:hypothetical protein
MEQEGGCLNEREARRSGFVSSPVTRHPSRIAVSLLAVLCVQPALALTIERAESHYVDKHYQFEFVATLDAPVERVQAVLRDYANYPTLDERILEARVEERPTEYAAILATTVRACFGPFCRNVKRVERVEEAPLELTAISDPKRSDVKFGETHTMLSVTEGRTRVSYRTAITPAFWVPAIGGRRWLLNTLSDATIELFKNVELRAQAPPAEKTTK